MYKYFPQVETNLTIGSNDYEMYAHALYSYTPTIGAQFTPTDAMGQLIGPVTGEIDLDASFQFGEGADGHSAQFLSNNMTRKDYWNQLLSDMAM